MYAYFSRCHVTTNSVAPTPLQKLHTTHNSSIRSDEVLTLETSVFRISVRWLIYINNSVDKTKFCILLLHRRSTLVSLETILFIKRPIPLADTTQINDEMIYEMDHI